MTLITDDGMIDHNDQPLTDSPNPRNLLFNANGDIYQLTADVADRRTIAADKSLPMEERLEAFEDIIDSEVGDTPLIRARNLEREVGLRQIYLKFEGGNPTGAQKDRIAFTQVMDAMRRGFEAITVATCGNYGAAIALASSLAGIQCHIFIPGTYHTGRLTEMEELGANIRRIPGDYEHAVELSQAFAEQNELYDANPGGSNTPIQLRGYGEIANEIYDELRDAPSIVAVPVSNGTTLAGIYKGFLSLYRRGKTSHIPRITAGSSYKKNPIVEAFRKGLPTCDDLDPELIHETRINEPLINWRAIDGDEALFAIYKSQGWGSHASDKSMQTVSKWIRDKEGLSVLPASTAGLIALIDEHKRKALPGDRYVAILTGRKV